MTKKEKAPTVKIDRDFEAILICAVRYSMGRMTYMPGLVQCYILPLLPHLSDNFVNVVIEDLELNEKGFWGDECDRVGWMSFQERLIEEKERRQYATDRAVSGVNSSAIV